MTKLKSKKKGGGGGVFKSIKRKVGIAKTALKTAARVVNPIGVGKIVGGAIRGKGIIFPGSKYIGPGNSMNKGNPKGKGDAAAYQHDVDYDDYIKSGKVKKSRVYLGYSDADERLRNRAKKNLHKDTGSMAAYVGMSLKKGLHKITGSKRIKDKKVYGETGKSSIQNPDQIKASQYLANEKME